MEFLLFLSGKDQQILELMYKANFSVEENTPLCLLGKKFFGFYKKEQKTVVICTDNAMRIGGHWIPKAGVGDDFSQTRIYIRRALRHEAVHVAQSCNNDKPLGITKNQKITLHPYKKEALEASTRVSGNRIKEYEAYSLEDKPNLVKSALKKYCL